MGVITIDYDEAEYLFENDIIFNEKILGGMDTGLNLTNEDIADKLWAEIGPVAATCDPEILKELGIEE